MGHAATAASKPAGPCESPAQKAHSRGVLTEISSVRWHLCKESLRKEGLIGWEAQKSSKGRIFIIRPKEDRPFKNEPRQSSCNEHLLLENIYFNY